MCYIIFFFFFSSRRRHTRFDCDWSSDVCSSDLDHAVASRRPRVAPAVTTTLKDEPELMWHGDGVKMAEVLEALNRIRADFARAEAGDHEHAHPRNCVMTLVAVSATQAEERRAQRT